MKDERKHEYCPNIGTPYLFQDNGNEKTRKIIKARCKLWTCDYCKHVNKYQHYIRILNGCNELQNRGIDISFTTITSHEKLKTLKDCRYVWSSAWNKLRGRARRRCKKLGLHEFTFVWVPETHRDGRLHFHMLNTGNFSTRWWKDNSRSCGLGYQCKTNRLESTIQGVNYVTKYMSKTMDNDEYPQKMRRVNYSKKFPSQPTANRSTDWQVADTTTSIVDLINEGWIRLNYDVYLHGQQVTEIIDM